jgi:hypothetical protein
MDYKELMIDNIVCKNESLGQMIVPNLKELYQLKTVGKFSIGAHPIENPADLQTLRLSELSPVPITHELLMRLLFLYDPKNTTYRIQDFVIEYLTEGYQLYFQSEYNKEFVFLHELQNIFYWATRTHINTTCLIQK